MPATSLVFSVLIALSDSEERSLSTGESLRVGDHFAVSIQSPQRVFAVLAHLRPNQPPCALAELDLAPGIGPVRMPAGSEYLKVPGLEPGERLCIVVSSESLTFPGISPGSALGTIANNSPPVKPDKPPPKPKETSDSITPWKKPSIDSFEVIDLPVVAQAHGSA
jgi:hypothetical protein